MFSAFVVASLLTIGQPEPKIDDTIVIRGRAPIVQALFNPDGKRLYFSTHAGIEGHDIETGKRLFDVPGGRDIACSPKGDLLAAVHINIGMISISGTIAVIDAYTGKLKHTQSGTYAWFSPDSRWLISNSGYDWGHPARDEPPKLQITDLRTGKMHLAQLTAKKGGTNPDSRGNPGGPFHFTKDGKLLVSRSKNQFGKFESVAACDLETGKAVKDLPKDDDLIAVRDPNHSDDGKRYINDWKVLDVETGKEIVKLEPLPKEALAGGWHPKFYLSGDGKSVCTVTTSRREMREDAKTGRTTLTLASHLHTWDADTGKLKPKTLDARRVATLPSGTLKKLGRFNQSESLFTVNRQGTHAVDYDNEVVTVWDLKTGKSIRTMRNTGPNFRPEIVRFSPDGKWVAAAATSGEVALWNPNTGEAGPTLDHAPYLGDVCFRPKSNELIGAGQGGVYVWDLKSGELKRHFEHKGNLFQVACRPDGKLAAVSDHWSDTVMLIDIDTGKTTHNLPGKGRSLCFHPDGSLLTLDPSGTIRLFDTDSAKKLQQWPGGKSGDYRYTARRIVFLPGGDRALLGENNTVAIVDVKTGKRVLEHEIKNEARNQLHDVDVHPDGKRFVIAYGGKQDIEERDLETGKVLRTLPGYTYGSVQARYSPDGLRLITSGSYVHDLRIYPVVAKAKD